MSPDSPGVGLSWCIQQAGGTVSRLPFRTHQSVTLLWAAPGRLFNTFHCYSTRLQKCFSIMCFLFNMSFHDVQPKCKTCFTVNKSLWAASLITSCYAIVHNTECTFAHCSRHIGVSKSQQHTWHQWDRWKGVSRLTRPQSAARIPVPNRSPEPWWSLVCCGGPCHYHSPVHGQAQCTS